MQAADPEPSLDIIGIALDLLDGAHGLALLLLIDCGGFGGGGGEEGLHERGRAVFHGAGLGERDGLLGVGGDDAVGVVAVDGGFHEGRHP